MITAYSSLRHQKYGVLRGPSTMTATQRIQWTKNTMKSDWIRLELKIFNDDNSLAWNGSNGSLDLCASLGLKVLLGLTAYPTGYTHTFVPSGNLTAWKNAIADILDTYPRSLIPAIVIDNEEMNENYHQDAIANIGQYVQMLNYAYQAAHPRGVKVANGGFGNDSAHACIAYRWVRDNYNTATADSFASGFMPSFQINAAKNSGSNSLIESFITAMMQVVNSGYYDYINIHRYTEVDKFSTTGIPNMFRFIKESFEDITKKPFITNETGLWIDMTQSEISNTQATLWNNVMQEFYRLGIEHIQLWDGDGLFAIPFSDPNSGTLLPNGIAHKNFITRQLA